MSTFQPNKWPDSAADNTFTTNVNKCFNRMFSFVRCFRPVHITNLIFVLIAGLDSNIDS